MNQQKEQPSSSARRSKAYVSSLGTTQLHLRNPFIIAWWSVAFPGFGHFLLSKYIRGFFLFIWEIVVNYESGINEAFLYSFTGRFELAKEAINTEWVLLYLPLYIFAIWDSYRTCVDLNRTYILAAREDAEIKGFRVNSLEINYLDKRDPWNAALWSAFMPGAGQLLIHRIITASLVLTWWVIIIYQSKFLPAVHHTFMGDFELARQVVHPQWFLNIPSVYFFAIYDAYVNTVEKNRLFDWEQSKFLRKQYQDKNFSLPFKRNESQGENMYVISTFDYSQNLELAVTALQMKGLPKQDILAVPVDKKGESKMLLDTIHQSDSMSLLDLPAVTGMFFSLYGAVYGFILAWGPIIWGVIGMLAGFGLGLIIKLLIIRKYSDRQDKKKAPEVVLIIQCGENQIEMVQNTLWENHALGVGKLSLA